MQENYLAKWLNNELTEEELAVFKKSDEYASYQRILEASKTMEGPDFDVEDALQAIKNKRILQEPKVVQLKPFRRFLKVAAAVTIIMVGSYFYLNTLNENITTQFAENKEVILPDSSEIIMNADSKIAYSKKKWDTERNVSLNGEAFFKVAKGERFTVTTDHGTVAVLGTQFNVEGREGFFEVTCFEGLVSVSYKGSETKLPAGTSFMVVEGEIVPAEEPKNLNPSWMDNESTFKSIPLKYVLDEFQRQHNVKVKTQNIDLGKLFTGTFSNTNTDLALQSISVPSRIKFKLEGNKVLFYAESAP
ncbi:FecR family protein [Maribacter arenosus]|uniref:FecR domain-containing protein n=1 Tax=Maribacter arenosus TaxID=1854708 RepID=A0ABR7VAN3_9FLAO|nr:FecR domain-containing protein [Maribacter arenosus]MBD0850718.1 FecR domain-containing protein [Maribacter arenosus]